MHQELLMLGKTRPFCFMHYTNIGKVEIFHVKVKVALLITRTHSEWGWDEKLSAKVNPDMFKALIKRWIFDASDKIEIRLPCCWTVLKFWNVSGGLLVQTYILWTLLRGDLQL